MTTDSRNTTPALPGAGLDPAKMPAFWLLARLGKRVLRPGGRALTRHLLTGLGITASDRVVELAPGLGTTTRLILEHHPRSYTGIEKDERAAAMVRGLLPPGDHECRARSALDTGLARDSATVVFGEAYLTMQPEAGKRDILAEAFRVLAPGGRFGLHELAITPDGLDAGQQDSIRADLSDTLHVGALPLTSTDWRALLEGAGFEVRDERTAPMGLLRPLRLVQDEGLLGAARFTVNVLRDKPARQRVRVLRAMFDRQRGHLTAIMLIAAKPSESVDRGSRP